MTYLPSSPIANHVVVDDDDDYSNQLFNNKRTEGFYLKGLVVENEEYPTPNPSSTIGRSSPFRSHVIHAPTSPIGINNYESENADADADVDVDVVNVRDVRDVIRILIDSTLETQSIIIGRQSKFCDVVLPRKKNISRKHALVSYSKKNNSVKIECLGSNGLVVNFPNKMTFNLVRRNPVAKVYELEPLHNKNKLVFSSEEKIVEKESNKVINVQNLNAFVLLQGESVIMPYLKNILLDFRTIKAILKKSNTKGQETNSSQSIKNNYTTPNSVNIVRTPSTPIKTMTGTSHQSNSETPIVAKNKFAKDSIKHKVHKPEHAKKLEKSIEPINKRSNEEIIESLTQRGYQCQDLRHVLANHLAFSNVQQTPLTQLSSVNSKINELTKTELRCLLTVERCIGVIYRQGKDAAGKPLDEEYYYDLENDSDEERRTLVASLKGGRTGLRSCRRTHKQYFWKKPAKK